MTITDVLKPKSEEDIQRDLNKLTPARRFVTILRVELEKEFNKLLFEIPDLAKACYIIDETIVKTNTESLDVFTTYEIEFHRIQICVKDYNDEFIIIDTRIKF